MKASYIAIGLIARFAAVAADQCDNQMAVLQAAVDLGTNCDSTNPSADIAVCLQPLPLREGAQLYQDCCACNQVSCEQVAAALFTEQGGSVEGMCNAMIDGSNWCVTQHSFGPKTLMDCCPGACQDPCVLYASQKFESPSVHKMCLEVASTSFNSKDHCGEMLPSSLTGRTLAECCPIACHDTCENYARDHYSDGTMESMCNDILQSGGSDHELCKQRMASNSPMVGKDCCPEACSSPCEKFAQEHFQNQTVHQMCLDIEAYGGYRHGACAEKVVGDATVAEECCVESCGSPCATYAHDHFDGHSVDDMCSAIATVGHEHETCNAQIGDTTQTIGKDCCVEACTSPCEAYAKQNFNGETVHAMCLEIENAGGSHHESCAAPIGGSTLSAECCPMACRTTCEIFASNHFQKNSVDEMCQVIADNGGHTNDVCQQTAGVHTHILGKDCCPSQCRDSCENYAFNNFNGASVHSMCLATQDAAHGQCENDVGDGKKLKDCCPVGCRDDCENHAIDHFGKNSVDEMCDVIQNSGGSEHESCGTLQGAKTPTLGSDCCPMACRPPCEAYANENFDNKNVDGMCNDIQSNGGHQHAACKAQVKDSTVGEQCCREACEQSPCEAFAVDRFQVESVSEMCARIVDSGGFENDACSADVGEFKVREECCVEACRTPCEKYAFENFNSGTTVDDMCNQIEGAGGYQSDRCSAAVGDSTVSEKCCTASCRKPCEKHAYEFFGGSTVTDMCIAIKDNGGHDNSACNDMVGYGDNTQIGQTCCPESCRTGCETHAFENFGGASVDGMCQAIQDAGGHENEHCTHEVDGVAISTSCCVKACRSPCEQYAWDHFGDVVPGMCFTITKIGGWQVDHCSATIGSSTLNKECCVQECYKPCESYGFEHFNNADVDEMCLSIKNSGGHDNIACGDNTVKQTCCVDACREPCEAYAFERFNGVTTDQMCTEIKEAGGSSNPACNDSVGSSTVGEACCQTCAEVEDSWRRNRRLRSRAGSFL